MERFGDHVEPAPPVIVPAIGRHLWDWYYSIGESVRRVREGVCEPLPPSEFVAWSITTGNVIHPWEYAILRAMDRIYCRETNLELIDYQERQKEAMAADASAAKKKRGWFGRGKG